MSETDLPAQFVASLDGTDALRITLAGTWKTAATLPGINPVLNELQSNPQLKRIVFDPDQLGEWDSRLLSRLIALNTAARKQDVRLEMETLPAGIAQLIRLATAVPAKKDAQRQQARFSVLHRLGTVTLRSLEEARRLLHFLGESVLALFSLLRGQARFQWSEAWVTMQQCGPGALGIVLLINFLVGLILAFVGSVQLAQFGASIYVADLVGIATVREMGALMTAVIMCGRTGAAFAAQLGTMRVNEEIDAFEAFGISPMEFLVLPRMIALLIMMPVLCVFADLIAIFGGFLVAVSMLDLTATEYFNRTVDAISSINFCIGIFKSAVFGMLVALAGCLRGMYCGRSAAAVGEATTSAVVTGITWIIASDAVLAVLCQALGI